MINLIKDITSYQKTLNAISLAKLLNFAEKDIKNGKTIPHKDAIKIFRKTLNKKK